MQVGSEPDSIGTNLSLMMLKPRNSHPNHPTWPLMFKNVYYLGTTQINPEGFEVKILNKNATPVSDRDKSSSIPYITLFGLDSVDNNGSRNYDELIDKDLANIILEGFPDLNKEIALALANSRSSRNLFCSNLFIVNFIQDSTSELMHSFSVEIFFILFLLLRLILKKMKI